MKYFKFVILLKLFFLKVKFFFDYNIIFYVLLFLDFNILQIELNFMLLVQIIEKSLNSFLHEAFLELLIQPLVVEN